MTIEQKIGICVAVAGASWLLPVLWTWVQSMTKKIESMEPVAESGGGLITTKPTEAVVSDDQLIRVDRVTSEASDTELVKQVLGLILDARDIAILLGEEKCCEHLDAAAAAIFTWEDKANVE